MSCLISRSSSDCGFANASSIAFGIFTFRRPSARSPVQPREFPDVDVCSKHPHILFVVSFNLSRIAHVTSESRRHFLERQVYSLPATLARPCIFARSGLPLRAAANSDSLAKPPDSERPLLREWLAEGSDSVGRSRRVSTRRCAPLKSSDGFFARQDVSATVSLP